MNQAIGHRDYLVIILALVLVLLTTLTIFSIWFINQQHASSYRIENVEQVELRLPQLNFQKYNSLEKASKLVIQ